MQFDNKRIRPEEIDWVQENFKDSKLRVFQYLQYGLDNCNIPENHKKEILKRFETLYDKIGTINTVTKAALMLKTGLVSQGYDPTDKWITKIYNLAPNVLTHRTMPSW